MLPKIVHPTFEFTIPSNKQKIKLRPFVVREEKILLIAKQSGERSDIMNAIKQIVNNCIVHPEGFTIDNLAIFDLEYLFIKLRAISVSNKTNVSYRDNEDDKIYDFEIDLDKLEIDLTDAPDKKITLTKNIFIELNWPSAADYSNPELYQSTDDKIFNVLLAMCMNKVHEDGKTHDVKAASKEELEEFIDNIPAKAADEIRNFLAKIPSLKHEIKYTNSKGTDRLIVLNSLDDFFTP